MTTTTLAANDLHAAADWLAAHPDLGEPYSVSRYGLGVDINYRTEDADVAAEMVDAVGDGYRWTHQYDDGPNVSITNVKIGDRLGITVVVERAAVTA